MFTEMYKHTHSLLTKIRPQESISMQEILSAMKIIQMEKIDSSLDKINSELMDIENLM